MKEIEKKLKNLGSEEQWNDWHWQQKNRITDYNQLKKFLNLLPEEEALFNKKNFSFRVAITPYYLSLIDENNPFDPIRLQAIPRIDETHIAESDMADPLHEDADAPVRGLTHRYPDRALMFITDQCAMYCRHCTRRRKAGETDAPMPNDDIDKAIDYIKKTPEIRDVILSGGDPLTLSDEKLDKIIAKIYEIEHVDIIRIGSRIPVVLPQRITDGLINVLKKYPPIWFNTHFNHPNEFTKEAKIAIAKLADNGIVLGNQSVLLRNINDNIDVMKNLVHQLAINRIRPYYIYQCDLSNGIEHFRTPVSKGIEIIESLRGHTSGLCVPTFVVDAPGGGGKIPVMPNYVISQAPNKVILRNYEGFISAYTEPIYTHIDDDKYTALCEKEHKSDDGVISLYIGKKVYIEPKDLKRKKRVLKP
ncbi:MAG: lysine 2,3-aminomutase [Candidatus Cloacimonetes bacterium]|nr:lysine 2,3-aminomutase [Candidatus Cloacimonadota bacterium]